MSRNGWAIVVESVEREDERLLWVARCVVAAVVTFEFERHLSDSSEHGATT